LIDRIAAGMVKNNEDCGSQICREQLEQSADRLHATC